MSRPASASWTRRAASRSSRPSSSAARRSRRRLLKLICFDCDSTLSSIEGIDELARIRGPEAYSRVEALTNDAMNGAVRMEDVFGLRMEIVRPGANEAAAVGRRYVETVEATAKA